MIVIATVVMITDNEEGSITNSINIMMEIIEFINMIIAVTIISLG